MYLKKIRNNFKQKKSCLKQKLKTDLTNEKKDPQNNTYKEYKLKKFGGFPGSEVAGLAPKRPLLLFQFCPAYLAWGKNIKGLKVLSF